MILFPKRKKAKNPMTDETKRLFDAPWRIHKTYPNFVMNPNNLIVAECGLKDANRIARLPELYDALVEAARHCCNLCHTLSGQDEPKIEDLLKNGCPKAQYKNRAHVVSCVAMEWLDLLKKVRDGE